MRLGLVTFLCCWSCSFVGQTESAPLTCYSRAVALSEEIMTLLEKIHNDNRTMRCAEILPKIFLDVHNQCITSKLRDFLYVLLNHPNQSCKKRRRMESLKLKVQNLHFIITRICFRVRASLLSGDQSRFLLFYTDVKLNFLCRIWCSGQTTVRRLTLDLSAHTLQKTDYRSSRRRDELNHTNEPSRTLKHHQTSACIRRGTPCGFTCPTHSWLTVLGTD
uniref:Cytokine like 1 n=1 Tax=Nothobranchius furzeri TaxID=105023 RepID=A0A8C6LWV5_NOTFU